MASFVVFKIGAGPCSGQSTGKSVEKEPSNYKLQHCLCWKDSV